MHHTNYYTVILVGSSGILNSILHRKYLGKDCAAACNQMVMGSCVEQGLGGLLSALVNRL